MKMGMNMAKPVSEDAAHCPGKFLLVIHSIHGVGHCCLLKLL